MKTVKYAIRSYGSALLSEIGRNVVGARWTTPTGDVALRDTVPAILEVLQESVKETQLVCGGFGIVRITTETAEPTTSLRVIHIDAEIPEGAQRVGYVLRAAGGLSCGLLGHGAGDWTFSMNVTEHTRVFTSEWAAGLGQAGNGPSSIMQVIEETTTPPEPVVTIEEVA